MSKVAVLTLLFLLIGCSSEYSSFHSSAFFKPSKRVLVLDSNSRIADNFSKKEYSWLVSVKADQAWLKEVTSNELEVTGYDYQSITKLLIGKFPHAFPDKSIYDLYHVGEEFNGREHYLLKTKGIDHIIYYIATI